uniref:Uncharacterized protein n=1 Tax=Ignisphaera aggregans TaxID=334771 RepID=A0A7C2VL56_9CREN
MNKFEPHDITSIRNTLINSGFEKIYTIDENPWCILLLGIYGGNQYLILLAKGDLSWYSKVVPAANVLEPYWRCNYIVYVPEGLYVFADNAPTLVEKIISLVKKFSRVSNR